MIRVAPLLAVLCLPAVALAQNPLPDHLASRMERQPDVAMRAILDDFLRIAPDGRLAPDDMTYAEALAAASVRAEELAVILAYDLDGDGAISVSEVAAHDTHRIYRIVAPIPRLPPRLHVRGWVTFFLAPGVAPPPASGTDPARVIDEATGDCVPGFSCD